MLVAQRKPKFNMLRLMNAKPWNIRKKQAGPLDSRHRRSSVFHTVGSKHIKSAIRLREYYDIYIYIYDIYIYIEKNV